MAIDYIYCSEKAGQVIDLIPKIPDGCELHSGSWHFLNPGPAIMTSPPVLLNPPSSEGTAAFYLLGHSPAQSAHSGLNSTSA
jgi:hypothetical protein